MLNNYTKKTLLLLALCMVTFVSSAQDLMHYWNFNTVDGTVEMVAADYSIVAGTTSITDPGTGSGYMDDVSGNILNAQNGDPAGNGLRPRNPSNTRSLVIAFPTTGYEDLTVSFATKRTGSGATEQYYSYSIDGGANYITTDLATTTYFPTEDYTLVTVDFSTITTVENNADFIFKIDFGGENASGSGGNNRFDNLAVMGTLMDGVEDVTAPLAVFTPANEDNFLAINTNPQIVFNEAVRLLNDSEITDTNAASLVELRLNDADGANVPFTTTFTDNTITIIPSSDLMNEQQYYVALLGNTVEDMSDNAVTDTQSVTFNTIAIQTEFTAGDMVVTAYRMNASSEDEIALLTLVDITPNTFIYLTDSKYTSNAQPQCGEAIMWTATQCVPAGSVITIQTGEKVSNLGTVTGNDFGLSSSGDQVIVYTGSATAPNYITAMSSNAWLADNTSCSGNESMIPAGLVDGTSSISLATAPDNIDGNTVNAYYNGTQTGTATELKTAILNPENWVGTAAGTDDQTWPTWNFPSAPTVQEISVVNNTTIIVTFNNELNETSAAILANYAGIDNLGTATVDNNVVTLTYTTAFETGTDYELTINNVEDGTGLSMACAYTYSFGYNTELSFDTDFIVVSEDAGTVNVVLNLVNPSTASVDLVVKTAPFSTADANDFTYTTTTLNFTGTSALTQTITIPVIDDTEEEQHAEYFVLSLENASDVTLTDETFATIYIKDNDRMAPQPSQSIELQYVGSFDPSGEGTSTCEIVVYDADTERLFTTSAAAGFLDIIDFSNPESPSVVSSVDMNTYGGITCVAVKDGVVAVASPNTNEQLNGSVVFFDTDGTFISQVTVGALPDNITFTPNGTKVITADEGQPGSDYTTNDPEGSISIIDITGGAASLTNANVTTLDFTSFNTSEADLIAAGVRKVIPTSTLSQDMEPEYVAVSADSQKAWISLQESNAIAEINLTNNTITDVWALGTKDMSAVGNGFDISDKNGEILIANWPIQAYYTPDAIATYNVNGVNYIITANEGDEKEYGSFEERTTIGNDDYILDATAYPQSAMLKNKFNAGRMRVTNVNGNTDTDNDFDQIYCLGSRSFSIFNADTKEIVFDSGDDFEMYIANDDNFSAIFNADNEDNELKGRSRAKGPEPEGVTIATIGNNTFAFIGLERVGGVMVYDVTDPAAPVFVDYKNNRSTSAFEGDHAPEGITFISSEDSPNDKNYVVVANEISGTLTIFEVDTTNLGTTEFVNAPKTFAIFPNPATDGVVYFNRVADIDVYDLNGKLIHSEKQALTINTTKMASGMYIIKTSEGIVKKLIVK